MAANRRQYTAEFKAKLVLQLLSGEKTSGDLCRGYPQLNERKAVIAQLG